TRQQRRDALGVPRRTHLREQPVCLGELARGSHGVTGQTVQLRAFDVDVWAPALGSGLIDELRYLREEGLDRLARVCAVERTQTASVRNRGLALLDGLALPLGDRDGLRGHF